jgi:hypothetical protein
MIILNQGLTNSVVLRLNDNIVGNNPIFLFELTCVQSNQVFLFTAEDFSTTSRYNNFIIDEIGGTGDTPAPTASVPKIQLEFGGSYLYKVYEADSYDLIPTDIILDSGKALFINGEYQSFFFELGDDDEVGVFVEFDDFVLFDEGDADTLGIFDPEFMVSLGSFVLTETGDKLITETGDNLIWI